jgi:hypothetical protein
MSLSITAAIFVESTWLMLVLDFGNVFGQPLNVTQLELKSTTRDNL